MTMNIDLSHLNDRQREAALCTEGPLLILAGAGSGKTTVLIERVAQLIRKGTPPWSILAITFTKKAAGELQRRLENMLGPQARDVWASTFHATCARILRRDIEKLGGFTGDFAIYDTDDSVRVMKAVVRELNIDEKMFPPKTVLSLISRAKDAFQTPEAYAKEAAGDFRLTKVAQLYAAYQTRLRKANALDFDDLVFMTVQLLQTDRACRDYYQRKFRYVLVDEYQDTNRLQYELTRLLAGGLRNLCVVGDDDQSIYRFRGATIANILNFESEYPDAKVVRLEENYRSTAHILEAANGVIAHNQGRKGKTLWTAGEEGVPIQFYQGYSDGDEADFVADVILREGAPGRYNEFCVLYRMNAQANRIEDALKRQAIPYRIVGGTRFFDHTEIRDALAYLQVLHNPADDLRLRRIINVPNRKLGDVTLSRVAELAAREGVSLFAIAENAGRFPALSAKASILQGFAAMIRRLRAFEGPLPLLYDKLLEETGIMTPYIDKADMESQGRLENLLEFKSSLIQYQDNNEQADLGGFLEEVALFTDVDRYDDAADAVVLMTMHSAKGLEFPTVFLVGAEEGIFPSARSSFSQEDIEEERRLCYVAITRAKRRLYITSARERMLFGQTTNNRVSRFVDEIPEKCLEGKASMPVRTRVTESRPGASRRPGVPARGAGRGAGTSPPPAVYQKGEMVRHKAFGRGMIVGIQPMGGDALLEIAFDGVGTKRLMQKSAAAYLAKEEAT